MSGSNGSFHRTVGWFDPPYAYRLLQLLLITSWMPVFASAAPFHNGDSAKGKEMVERDCVACHARHFDGDASKIYTRADRKVQNPAQLASQIAVCNSQLNTQYFPEDEEHVAAFLNKQYYHFK